MWNPPWTPPSTDGSRGAKGDGAGVVTAEDGQGEGRGGVGYVGRYLLSVFVQVGPRGVSG